VTLALRPRREHHVNREDSPPVQWPDEAMAALRVTMVLAVTVGTAVADPASSPAASAPATTSGAGPPAPGPPSSARRGALPSSIFDVPKPTSVPSLRLEAARVVAERFDDTWRFPAPGALVGLDGAAWFVGAGYYQPRSTRSAALHGGSIAATILGEVLLAANSPLAGVGALLTGATLDAAAADADLDAEARR
jgi:hypothetical protein